MLPIDQYKPYNFSSTKCFVFNFQAEALKKIEEKIPPIAKRLKGIFVSARCKGQAHLLGTINLNFNDGALKCYNLPVINSYKALKNTIPIVFDEELKRHSSMTGYYRDFDTGELAQLYLTIYIHYTI